MGSPPVENPSMLGKFRPKLVKLELDASLMGDWFGACGFATISTLISLEFEKVGLQPISFLARTRAITGSPCSSPVS